MMSQGTSVTDAGAVLSRRRTSWSLATNPSASVPTRWSVAPIDIWISTPDIGTYSFDFDTLAGKWSKAGSKWLLPFHGRADYFPEYNSWLGFAAKSGLLCSVDLSTASVRTKPAVHRVLEEDMQVCGMHVT